jgi:hypothetical protein
VAWAKDLYTVMVDDPARDPLWVDKLWTPVEQRLPDALTALEQSQGPLDARLWCEVLVPFFAQFFVRGIDFAPRFRERWAPLLHAAETRRDARFLEEFTLSKSNINSARVLEMQRLLSPVMRARWWILRSSSDRPFITSNLGYARLARGTVDGVVIPISASCAVHLQPRPRHVRIYMPHVNRWLVDVDPVEVDAGVVRRVNRRVAQFAPNEIYGASRDGVEAYRREMNAKRAKAQELVWDDPRVLRRNQLELFRTLTAIATSPGQPQLSFEEALDAIRYPAPVMFQANPEAGTGLSDAEEAEVAREEEAEREQERRRLEALVGVDADLAELTPP